MDPIEHAMTVQARTRGELRLPTAEGELQVPAGALEIDFGDGMAHLKWTDAAGAARTAAIHPDDYERYVAAGWILPSVN